LCKVIRLKLALKDANLNAVRVHKTSHKAHEIILRMGQGFNPEQVFGLLKNTQAKWVITANALKLELPTLPVTWYDDLVATVGWLKVEKKKGKKVKKKN